MDRTIGVFGKDITVVLQYPVTKRKQHLAHVFRA